MYGRQVLLIALLTTACLSSACSGTGNGVATPTAPGSNNGASNSGSSADPSRDTPSPPPTPPPLPPPVPREPSPPGPTPPPATGSCDHTKAQFAIGQRASNDLLERARIAAGAGVARFIRPNQPITMEYSGARLNLGLTEADVVNGAYCG